MDLSPDPGYTGVLRSGIDHEDRGLSIVCPPERSSAALAQLDRALVSGTRGHRFESCMSHHEKWGESDE